MVVGEVFRLDVVLKLQLVQTTLLTIKAMTISAIHTTQLTSLCVAAGLVQASTWLPQVGANVIMELLCPNLTARELEQLWRRDRLAAACI